MSIAKVKKAIKDAREELEEELPAFFFVPKDDDVEPHTVPLDPRMKTELHDVAMTMLERADTYDQIAYDPDHRITRGTNEVLLAPTDSVNEESTVYEVIQKFDELNEMHARNMVKTASKFYGIAYGTTPENRILFVRQKKVEGITADGKLFAIAGDALRPIRRPGILIDRIFDLIVFPDGIAAFDSVTFDKLVKDPEDVLSELNDNAKAVAKHVPFAPGMLKKLIERGETKPMIRRKFRSIVERNHLVGVTIEEIRKGLRDQNTTPSNYIKNKKFDFDISEAMFVLNFLDEATWRGWKSKKHYAAGGRTELR